MCGHVRRACLRTYACGLYCTRCVSPMQISPSALLTKSPPPRPPSPLCRDLHFVYTNMPALDSCQWLG